MAIYGAVIGTVSLLATIGFKTVEIWRDRTGIKVRYAFQSEPIRWGGTTNLMYYVSITAHSSGRRPIKVTGAAIQLNKGIKTLWPWQKNYMECLPAINGVAGMISPFPVVLDERTPEAIALMPIKELSEALERTKTKPTHALIWTSKGDRRQRLSKSTVDVLLKKAEVEVASASA